MTPSLPTFYLSHGGGPWPYMSGDIRRRYSALEQSLKELPRQLEATPKAILVISAHWEERAHFAVMANPAPPLIYDYRGFPEYLYHISYPAPGAPEIAHRVRSLIEGAGLICRLDPVRGFDHGTYTVLAVTHPDAATPVLQVSIRADYDPEAHLQLGRALAPLRDDGVLIIGSGSSYHNFHPKEPREESLQFDRWLDETLVGAGSTRRSERLIRWESAPAARLAHPLEDHLIPLHVAVGAAEGEPGRAIYRQEDFLGEITLSAYRFG